jgi:hypothetical protein
MKKESKVERFKKPSRILAFDGSLKLKGIFQSYNAAEKITRIPHQSIQKAVDGDTVSVKGIYWRELIDEDTIIDIDDLNKLSLLEYDAAMGQDRVIFATRNMKRGEEILESQFKNRFQVIKSRQSNKWKRSKLTS